MSSFPGFPGGVLASGGCCFGGGGGRCLVVSLAMVLSCSIRGAPRGPVGSRLPGPASAARQRRGRAAVLLVASAANTGHVLRRERHLHPLVAGGDRPADEVRTR